MSIVKEGVSNLNLVGYMNWNSLWHSRGDKIFVINSLQSVIIYGKVSLRHLLVYRRPYQINSFAVTIRHHGVSAISFSFYS